MINSDNKFKEALFNCIYLTKLITIVKLDNINNNKKDIILELFIKKLKIIGVLSANILNYAKISFSNLDFSHTDLSEADLK